jgi:uracil-DNA glycosylase
MNNNHAKQASRILFDNCREYISEEIKIFDPHILVTQGQSAAKAIEHAIINKVFSLKYEKNVSKANLKKPDFKIIEVNTKGPALWIHHYHPSNYGVFNKKVYPKYRDYAKGAAQFIAKHYSELL